jgi:hypothetical protein
MILTLLFNYSLALSASFTIFFLLIPYFIILSFTGIIYIGKMLLLKDEDFRKCYLGWLVRRPKDNKIMSAPIHPEYKQECNNIEEKGVKFVSETRLGGNPTDQLLAYSNEVNAGMAVIMTEQETGFTIQFIF